MVSRSANHTRLSVQKDKYIEHHEDRRYIVLAR